jgi:hypothetical protein
MDFSTLESSRMVGAALIGLGLLYMFEAILIWTFNMRHASIAFLIVLGFPLGAFGIFLAVLNYSSATVGGFSLVVLGALGFVLVGKALAKLHWATLIALAGGAGAAFAVWYYLGPAFPWYVYAIAGLVVFLVISAILHIVDLLFRVVDMATFPSPVLFLIGIIGTLEGSLVLVGLSLAHWL